jgi:hypothetical protein
MINIDHCSDDALLIYYNKDKTEFLAPKLELTIQFHLYNEY